MIRATRTPETRGGLPHGPPIVRYDTSAPWPGISDPFDARCWGCTWAYNAGTYQVKYRHTGCAVHRGRQPWLGRTTPMKA